ncbi:LacI family transcriptional regulator [Curtobacterium sp. MCBD17_013]|uniref:LacI family DNA-binding transcriptional regulator n=1 Tax=unclassified Curtobacterium TaxID=257496 RepID=UPI000DA8B716|nr:MULTISPECIES: LacI family DNA-binding transcriptional regulator [unclassified Curtobacterium]PZE77854.1 LacI family transcriptional regulator [Curtobacterium sp. MCBD17_019]PZF61534.1 LacI family transcriptional regulator [Curtobacterium sp. MCBD17_013]WIE54584.1 LacI family DNA-binding transcriptional regulator [Curtobacterium sp. MCBD17_003]
MALTSRDIARAAGVSQATVSRVLNGSPSVSDQTRERVLGAMRDVGYVPNAQAKAMRTARAGAIGIVTSEIQNPYLPYLLDELTRVAREMNVNVVVWNDDDPAMPLATAGVGAGTVDGVLFTAAKQQTLGIDRLVERGVPVLLCNRADLESTADIVMTDHFGTGVRAAEFLLERGRSHIAAIFGPSDTFASPAREAGFRQALRAAGVEIRAEQTTRGTTTYDTGNRAARELLAHGVPDAVFCSSDIIAYGAMDALRTAEVAVPERTWVLGIDGLPMSAWGAFDLTTFEQDITSIARASVQRLLDRIAGDTSEPVHTLVPARLVERGSTGAR